MKKYYFMLIFLPFGYGINAQVGINTDDPQATLHVEKRSDQTKPDGIIPPRFTGDELKAKSASYTSAQNGAIVYVTQAVTATNDPKTAAVITKGLFIYDAFASNGTGTGLWNVIQEGPATPSTVTGDGAYATRVRGTLTLIGLGINLLGSSIQTIPLPTVQTLPDANVDIASAQVTTSGTDSYYTIPSAGIYQVNYSYRTGQGLRLEILGSNRPGVIITKTAAGAAISTSTAVDYRYFGGISLGNITLPLPPPLNVGVSLTNLSLTQSQISHIYQFAAGDRVRFGVVTGGLAASVLTDASAEISIYKIR